MLQYLRDHFKNVKFDQHDTESLLFFLHYRVNCMWMVAIGIIVTLNLFAGDPIECTRALGVSDHVMASYCWSHSTYPVQKAYNEMPGKDTTPPGVDSLEVKAEFSYQDYYQWLCIILFIQGFFFYLPHGIWKSLEAGKMEQLTKNMTKPPSIHMLVGEEEKTMSQEDKRNVAAHFFYHHFGCYNTYALAYWFCEILAWLNIIFQAYFLDVFFQGEFISLGRRSFGYSNPLSLLFPQVTKCHFHKFGPQTLVETFDVLCVLPINALLEKIYLILWGWFLLLFIMSSLGIVMTILTITFPLIRGVRLSLITTSVLSPKFREIENLANYVGMHSGFGDWFILSILARKMDILDYKMFLRHLKHEISFSNTKERFAKEFKIGSI